ncbi:peptidylprolyl isomerase [Novosphingobium sp.]|uniref:peptidylprolyl isomerase n=1 Tax=Novosphingobium sp. TaxID=1874826 RepID=UPI00333E9DCB
MITRFAVAQFAIALWCAAFALSAGPAAAAPVRASHGAAVHKPAAAPDPAPIPLADTVRVALVTTIGTIEVDLDGKHAPITTANFLHYVDTKRFDGITFYRAMHLAWGDQPNGLVQGGLRDPRRLFPPIAHEPTSATGLSHKAGSLSMARNAPGTATADFSILLSDMSGLDADPTATDPDLQVGYAVFGHVVSGMDVARKIWDAPMSPTLGDGVMRGQMLADPVKVLTVRREPLPSDAKG